ncbi:c-type cytochrome [bacterium]|nr:c-type cytochrome [bacterium]
MSKPFRTVLWLVPVLAVIAGILYYSHTYIYKAGVKAGRLMAFAEMESQKVEEPDLRELARNTALAREGQALFKSNCARCHGDNGEGNGPQAVGLNPPPRNYRTQEFKFGNDIVSIFNTLRNGSPGTSMPSFSLLPTKDLFALAHYVRTLVPNPAPTTDDVLAQLPAKLGAGDTAPQGPRIPISFAMERIAVPAVQAAELMPLNLTLPGAKVYANNCAACHGAKGEGLAVDWISVDPYIYSSTAILTNWNASWYDSREEFARLVTHGLQGRVMPGNAELTEQEISDLFEFVRGMQN